MIIAETKNGKTTYRDALAEEIIAVEIPNQEPTHEERLDALETTTDDMILLMAELIGGE